MRYALTALLLVTLCWAAPASAQVAEVTVTGAFRPNALRPGQREFENTTPRGSFCNWRPDECAKSGAYIFDLGGGEYWTKSGEGDNASPRDTTYVRFPAARTVTFRDATSGASFDVRISFVAISLRLLFGNGIDPWYYGIGGGCTAIRGAGGVGWSNGGWGLLDPLAPQACYSSRARDGRSYSYRNVGIGINVELPNATSLQVGKYEAQESWTTGGAEADIDLGDNITGVQMIRMNFVFDVIHDFQVRFASDAPRVQLAPEGGWPQWTDHGRLPASMRQDLPFYLTSSLDFSVNLRCEHEAAGRCAIRERGGDGGVPLDVDITMPGMRDMRDNRPAQDTPLTSDDATAPHFTPDSYLVQRRSRLRFIAGREAVARMFESPGSIWEGNVTVVFDVDP